VNGLAHCNVYVSCQAVPGASYGLSVVGGENRVTLVGLNVTAGSSQVLNTISGNNQSGNAGGTLPQQLVATLTDNCGTAKPGVPVTWTVTQGSAMLTNTLSTSDAGGNVRTSVVLGQTSGAVRVTVTAGTAQAVFSLTNQVVAAFFSNEVYVGSGVYYLQFPNGNPFGYFNYVATSILYHYEMGYEAFIPGSAADIYLYDFSTGHWFYTSSTLFPYLYDFTLTTWIYYFPDTKNPGHYTTNPRYFSNLTTGQVFTM
jgi:hypothetical protein